MSLVNKALAIIPHSKDSPNEYLIQCDRAQSVFRFPGGSIELGETAADAIRREMREEYGLEVVVGDLCIVCENFFHFDGTAGHEIQLFHWCTVVIDDSALPLVHHEHADIHLNWWDITNVPGEVYPHGIERRLLLISGFPIHMVSDKNGVLGRNRG